MSEDDRPQVQNLRTSVAKVLEWTTEQLVQKQRLGDALNFEDALPSFTGLIELFADMKDLSFSGVPDQVIAEIASLAVQTHNHFLAVVDFQPNQANPSVARDKVMIVIKKHLERTYRAVAPHVAYAVKNQAPADSDRQQTRSIVGEMEGLRSRLFEVQAEAESTLTSIKDAAGETGIVKYATYFDQEATEHRRGAYIWMVAIMFVASATATLAYFSLSLIVEVIAKDDLSASIQFAISKLVFFSVIYYILVLCVRNYKAHRHNHVVNRHRYNALRTFQAFASTASDEATKNAVLLRATEAVFDANLSGYLPRQGDQKHPPQIMELIRQVTLKGD